jgi:hypothetical protein
LLFAGQPGSARRSTRNDDKEVRMRAPSPTTWISASALLALMTFGAAIAQQDMGNSTAAGATYTTGVVTARTPDSVTIEKDSGDVVTLLIDVATVGSGALQTDQRVRIDYHVNEYGQAVADVIQTAAAPDVVTVATSEPTAEAPPLPAAPQVATAAPAADVRELSPADEALPATASRLPLLVALGTLALAGAVALRIGR